MTNRPENIGKTGVLHLGVSDHSLIYGCGKIAFIVGIHKSSAFNECLFMSDWATNDPNALWNQFRNVLSTIYNMSGRVVSADTNSSRRREFVCPIQLGREWLKKLIIL